jgi:hypothetical protein
VSDTKSSGPIGTSGRSIEGQVQLRGLIVFSQGGDLSGLEQYSMDGEPLPGRVPACALLDLLPVRQEERGRLRARAVLDHLIRKALAVDKLRAPVMEVLRPREVAKQGNPAQTLWSAAPVP